jgi:hypothetical protein
VLTQSARATGYGTDHYYFHSSDGTLAEIQYDVPNGCVTGVCISHTQLYMEPAVTVFFVGNESDLAKFPVPTSPKF